MNINFPRWVKASFYKDLQATIETLNSLKLYFEESEYLDSEGNYVTKLDQWSEIDLEGPITEQVTKNDYIHTVQLSMAAITKLNNLRMYTHDSNVGIVYSGFKPTIKVYRYGDGVLDTSELIGCFNLQGKVTVTNFGRVPTALNLIHSVVQAEYKMFSNF